MRQSDAQHAHQPARSSRRSRLERVRLWATIRQLLPQRVAEVEDFVDFLRALGEGQHLPHAAAKASEASFAKVWDNDEDAAYDRM